MGEVLPFAPPALAPRDPRFAPPVVEMCQLASVWTGTLPPGEWEAEEKVDGIRAIWTGGKLWTREGVPLDLPHVTAELVRLERRIGQPMAIDGEYQEPGGFLDTLAVLGSRGRREPRGKLHVFDALPLDEWQAGEGSEAQRMRRHWIARAWDGFAPAHLVRVTAAPVGSAAEIDRAAAAVWERGGEGLMLKDAGATYARARSRAWLKVKRELSLTGEVVEILSRAARVAIGARVVRVAATEAQGSTLAVGMSVDVTAMEWTERGQLRHARIVGMRGDGHG
ncbi:hypothetical protein [Sphingomonas panaciterrae]|uniref:ATP-dependent DNA ligase n=1 Tax=Sphingomonas panaciterrae TaxID=1462999 RepID=UPI002FEE77EB